MRLRLILVTVFCFTLFQGFSQDFYSLSNDFNKWSVDGAVGFTKPYRSFTSGYWTPKIGFLSSDIGVRYMFNEYFGVKYSLGYNYYHSAKNSKEFSTDQYIMSLQGVVNAGRLLKIQSLSKKINVLAHAGLGKGNLKYGRPAGRDDVDHIFNIMGGLTGQLSLSDRFALNMDITGLANLSQDHSSFDGGPPNDWEAGIVFNGTVGVSYYFGKKKKHADWYLREDVLYSNLNATMDKLESKLETSHKDIEHKETELNKLNKQVALLEQELQQVNENVNNQDEFERSGNKGLDELIDSGYLTIYFDFNSFELKQSSFATINFLQNMMQKNPDLSILLEGFADESGDENYNLKLSLQRAEQVRKYLIELGADENRISIEGKGEVLGTGQKSKLMKQFARKVSVKILR